MAVFPKGRSLTHGGHGVGDGALVLREPKGRHLGGGEDDEGLSQGAEGLAAHHQQVLEWKSRPLLHEGP